jgi:hypothetical protein
VSRLKVVDAYFRAWDMRCNSENRNAAAVAVEQAVDEMQITWAATPAAHGELSREMSLGTGGEGRAFLMPHVKPFNRTVAA